MPGHHNNKGINFLLSQDTPKMPVRLFAHIHLDTELQGSDLEGNNTSEGARFLFQMAEEFDHKEHHSLKTLKNALQQVQDPPYLENPKSIDRLRSKLSQFKKDHKNSKGFTPEVVKNFALRSFDQEVYFVHTGKIEYPQKGDSFTISGGYSGVRGIPESKGHAVLYRFTKEKGGIFIDVLNTGSGVEHHFNTETQPPDWFQTQVRYQLSDNSHLQAILKAMAIPLILPTLPEQDDTLELKKLFECNMDPVYTALKQYGTQTEIDRAYHLSRSHVGQQSGTCSFRVFTPLIYALIPDPLLRERFRLYYKFRSIEFFYSNIQEKNSNTKSPGNDHLEDWKLLSCATSKLIRIIHKKIAKENNESLYLPKLLEIKQVADQKIQALNAIWVPISNDTSNKSSDNKIDFPSGAAELRLPLSNTACSLNEIGPPNVSLNSINTWIDQHRIRSTCELAVKDFYQELNRILAIEGYSSFTKKVILERLIKRLYEKNIHISTENINTLEKLDWLFNETLRILQRFQSFGMSSDPSPIPTHNINAFYVAATLSTIIREACQHAFRGICKILPYPTTIGLYELNKDLAGFIEKLPESVVKDLEAENYQKFNLALDKQDEHRFHEALKEDIIKDLSFRTIFDKNKNIDLEIILENTLKVIRYPKKLNFIKTDYKISIDKYDLNRFIDFLKNHSFLALYLRGEILLETMHSIDHNHFIENDIDDSLTKKNISYTQSKFSWKFSPAIQKLLDQNPDQTSIHNISQALVCWPQSLLSSEIKVNKKNNIIKEKKVFKEFIEIQGSQNETTILATAFANSRLKLYTILDYFSRHPEKLTNDDYQAALMMGLFGGGGVDLPALKKLHFSSLQVILEYHIKLFIQTHHSEHGVFLLELLLQFEKVGFESPFLQDKYAHLHPEVLEGCSKQPFLQKRVLCMELIHTILNFNAENKIKAKPLDILISEICVIIMLYKKQQALPNTKNHPVFSETRSLYCHLMIDHYDVLQAHSEKAKPYLAAALYPEMEEDIQEKLVASLSFDPLLNIYYQINEKKMCFNLADGEFRTANGEMILQAIPADYSIPFGKKGQVSHRNFIHNLEEQGRDRVSYSFLKTYDWIEPSVVADFPSKKMRFYFQKDEIEKKDKEGKKSKTETLEVFLQIDEQKETFQKIDVGYFQNQDIRSLLSEDPNDSIWVSPGQKNDDGKIIVLDQNMHVCFTGQHWNFINCRVKQVNKTDPNIQYRLILKGTYSDEYNTLQISEWVNHIQHFAGSGFRVFKIEPGEKWKLDILGYQISFVEDNRGNLIFSGNNELKLAEEKRINLPHSLTLLDQQNQPHVLIPNLPFIFVGKTKYFNDYTPDHDLTSFKGLKNCLEEVFNEYSKLRTFFQFKVDSTTGKPIPVTPEEKLFLCYYYMNTKQYDEAFVIIKDFRQSEIVEAKFEILELLRRIIEESPKLMDVSEKPPFNESILAIKIQALLIAANIKVSKKIQWPAEKSNNFILFSTINKVQSFFDHFPNQACHEQVLHYIRNVSQSVFPETMRVQNEDLGILLGLDLTQKLKQNRKFLEWKGRSSIIVLPLSQSHPVILTNLEKLETKLQKVCNHSEQLSLDFKPYWQTEIKQESTDRLRQDEAITKSISPFQDEGLKAEIKTAGIAIFKEKEEKNNLCQKAKELFDEEKTLNALKSQIDESMTLLEEHSNKKAALLDLCHEIQRKNHSVFYAIESKDAEWITFDDLIIGYIRNDFSEVSNKLGLPIHDPAILTITSIVENTMKAAIQRDRLQTIQASLEKYQLNLSHEANALSLMTALKEYSSEYLLNENNRELLVFEYHERKRLRLNQVQSIQHVMSAANENCCVQFIMGGGKTSVFLPLVAVKNADKDHLSVVIVPEALLAVNEYQLDQQTVRLFSSKSQTLHFDRHSSNAPDDFLRILNTLKRTRELRGYVVTSRETLQALELKYIELISAQSQDVSLWKSITLLEEILCLFREQGKAMIDEVDSVLYIRKEVNYSDGKEGSIDPMLVQDTLCLYKTMDQMQLKITPDRIKRCMQDLLVQLCEDKESIVFQLLNQYPAVKNSITGYLSGEAVSLDFMKKLSSSGKDRIALIKHQLLNLLPSTLLQELNVSYGFSKLHPERFSAIPYVFNNVPSESSRFSSPYETLNLTIQMNLASPIHPTLFEKKVQRAYIHHFNEKMERNTVETTASRAFMQLTGLDLEEVHKKFKQTKSLNTILFSLEKDPQKAFEVKCDLIAQDIAPEITYFPNVIKSDAIAFVDQLHSSMGISGTVQNHQTFHSRIQLEKSLNPDTDGRTLFHLLRKESKVKLYQKDKIYPDDIKSALTAMLSHPKTRAIIDIGALFTGISNEEVAICLKKLLITKKDTPIRHILYYDDKNRLYALSVNEGMAIALEQTDEDYVQSILQCHPSQRLTFYDQSHATGSDIRQMEDAHAVATISVKTRVRDLVQGVMRMRNFAEKQTVEFWASSEVNLDDQTVSSLIEFTQKNQKEELLEDHYRAACKKMAGSVRNNVMDLLLKEINQQFPDTDHHHLQMRPKVKAMVFQFFQKYLKMSNTANPYEQYGAVFNSDKVETVLEGRKKAECAAFREGIEGFCHLFSQQFRREFSIDQERLLVALEEDMDQLIKQSIPICKQEVESPVSAISGQVEIQVQQETKEQTQIEELQQMFGPSFKVKNGFKCKWKNGQVSRPDLYESQYSRYANLYSLKDLNPMFDECIFVTTNYGYLDNPEKSFDKELQYQRAHIFCLFDRNEVNKKLSCTVLTSEEASYYQAFEAHKKQPRWRKLWLEMPSGERLISGDKPEGIQKDNAYRKTLEQIQFLHGDVDLLLKNKASAWTSTLGLTQAQDMLNQVLSNPLFRDKRRYYHENQEKFLLYLQESEAREKKRQEGLVEKLRQKVKEEKQQQELEKQQLALEQQIAEEEKNKQQALQEAQQEREQLEILREEQKQEQIKNKQQQELEKQQIAEEEKNKQQALQEAQQEREQLEILREEQKQEQIKNKQRLKSLAQLRQKLVEQGLAKKQLGEKKADWARSIKEQQDQARQEVQNAKQELENALENAQKELEKIQQEKIVQKLLALTSNYLERLVAEQNRFHGPQSRTIRGQKIELLKELQDDLTAEKKSSLEQLENFYTRVGDSEAIKILTARRYLSKGVIHLGKVFMKSIVLCLSTSLDIITFGTIKLSTGSSWTKKSYSHLFKVAGKKFIADTNQLNIENRAAENVSLKNRKSK